MLWEHDDYPSPVTSQLLSRRENGSAGIVLGLSQLCLGTLALLHALVVKKSVSGLGRGCKIGRCRVGWLMGQNILFLMQTQNGPGCVGLEYFLFEYSYEHVMCHMITKTLLFQ